MPSLEQPANLACGQVYWRSLDQLADTAEFREFVLKTYPASMSELLDGAIDRRKFLTLMAASLSLAGLTGCRRPSIKILPYAKKQENVIAGLPTYYATALPRPNGSVPILVETHEGRPTKIEGHPNHPQTQGAADAWAQASVLDLYDPDRSRTVVFGGLPSTIETLVDLLATKSKSLAATGGEGFRILAEPSDAPSILLLQSHLKRTLPHASWHTYTPIDNANAVEAGSRAFGTPVKPQYKFHDASVVVAVDCDFLGAGDGDIAQIRGFAKARSTEAMNRLYVVEPHFTLTGAMADHRLRLPASSAHGYLFALAKSLGVMGTEQSTWTPPGDLKWIDEVAADLLSKPGQSLVVVGHRQPVAVHALAYSINAKLGNIGKTVAFSPTENSEPAGSIQSLADDLKAGKVTTLVILGGNPAYDAPAELGLGELIGKAETVIRLGLHVDETSELAKWHVPQAHPLESWGDCRASDGSLLAIQPQIEPLFDGMTAIELVARISGYKTHSAYEVVREAFKSFTANDDFETAWRRFLHDGFLEGSGTKPQEVTLSPTPLVLPDPLPPLSAQNLELVYQRDSSLDDGRFANNGWMQECPDPVTKLVWDNAAALSPKTADAMGIKDGDMLKLTLNGRSVEIAALRMPGQAEFTVAVPLGYGRKVTGRVGRHVGFDAYPLRTSRSPGFATGLTIAKTGKTHKLVRTQDHHTMEGRDIVREVSLEDLVGKAEEWSKHRSEIEERGALYPQPEFTGEHQWGMAIDLNSCIGCNACMVACQAENNIPIVGKDEVALGREMHWIRNDRYFSGEEDDPGMVHQPVACVQCENAPCEVVCPVNATVHSLDGLNLQVYNRCVGTRYCANNCPYKVRRFNFFNYNERPLDQLRLGPFAEKGMPETLQMQKNPDVTVRIRGVMEKCTYCVQRVERAKIGVKVAAADSVPGKIPDGTITPACAQTCPAQAIVFGDISDPKSRVSQLKANQRDYALLGELNTKPRTTYGARLKNPNPKMSQPGGHA